jgi:nicotinate-nucleotide adenylyltransferase
MKIGLFFGSFNPIHIGHLIIATHIINYTDLKRVWFVVSPQNPFKNSQTLLNERNRLHLVRLAIEDDSNFKASDVEFNLTRPSYTINTISHLKERLPQHDFSIIIGSDSLQNLHKWKNYEKLTSENSIFVFERPGFSTKEQFKNQVNLQNTPLLQISASFIRQAIKERKSTKYLVPDKVLEEIERAGYYK